MKRGPLPGFQRSGFKRFRSTRAPLSENETGRLPSCPANGEGALSHCWRWDDAPTCSPRPFDRPLIAVLRRANFGTTTRRRALAATRLGAPFPLMPAPQAPLAPCRLSSPLPPEPLLLPSPRRTKYFGPANQIFVDGFRSAFTHKVVGWRVAVLMSALQRLLVRAGVYTGFMRDRRLCNTSRSTS